MATYVFWILTTCTIFVVSVEGLTCFYCTYVETEYHHENMGTEDSCALGKTPLSSLSFDCSTVEYRVLPNMKGVAFGSPSLFRHVNNRSQRVAPKRNIVFTCATLTFKGIYTELFDGYSAADVYRGCVMSYYNRTIDEQCHKGKLGDLTAILKEKAIHDFLAGFSDEYDGSNTQTSICTCNENNCNANARFFPSRLIILFFPILRLANIKLFF